MRNRFRKWGRASGFVSECPLDAAEIVLEAIHGHLFDTGTRAAIGTELTARISTALHARGQMVGAAWVSSFMDEAVGLGMLLVDGDGASSEWVVDLAWINREMPSWPVSRRGLRKLASEYIIAAGSAPYGPGRVASAKCSFCRKPIRSGGMRDTTIGSKAVRYTVGVLHGSEFLPSRPGGLAHHRCMMVALGDESVLFD